MSGCRNFIEYVAQTAKNNEYVEFSLLITKWRVVKELIYILGIPYKATIALQDRKPTLSDTFGIWLDVKLHLQKVIDSKISKTALDAKLLDAFNNRYDAIFNNPIMKSAIYLDPRFRKEIIRNENATEIAKNTIIDIKNRLQFLNRDESLITHETSKNSANLSSDDSFGVNFDSQSAMNSYLDNQQITDLNHIDYFEAVLNDFDPPSLNFNESIIEYWNSDNGYDVLRDVALAILSVPPTEVQVERDFSKLKFILSDLRATLSTKNLQDILTTNLNQDAYNQVNAKQLEELKKSLN